MKAVSIKYAKTLFDLAVEQKSVDQTGKDLDVIASALASKSDLLNTFTSPRNRYSMKEALIEKLWKSRVSSLAFHFVRLVVKKGRIRWFSEIRESFTLMNDQREGRVRGLLISSEPLEDVEFKNIEKGFSDFLGREVHLTPSVNASVLGGVAVHIGHEVFDGTVRRRLSDIKNRLLAVS